MKEKIKKNWKILLTGLLLILILFGFYTWSFLNEKQKLKNFAMLYQEYDDLTQTRHVEIWLIDLLENPSRRELGEKVKIALSTKITPSERNIIAGEILLLLNGQAKAIERIDETGTKADRMIGKLYKEASSIKKREIRNAAVDIVNLIREDYNLIFELENLLRERNDLRKEIFEDIVEREGQLNLSLLEGNAIKISSITEKIEDKRDELGNISSNIDDKYNQFKGMTGL